MNNRIKELAEHAGLQPFEDCGPGYVYKMEKFANLIIQSCIRIADFHNDCNPMDYEKLPAWSHGYLQCAEDISDRIKEHFGVE